jgi:hypothetical protein
MEGRRNAMMPKRSALLAGAAAILAAAGFTAAQAAARPVPVVAIGTCSTEGAYVSCSVQGDIARPRSISVQVWASPEQKTDVFWDDLCADGSADGDRSGSFTVTAGGHHKVARGIPLAEGHGGICTPDVLVSPEGTGRIWVVLEGRG